MKFTCEKALLAEAINRSSRVVPSKSPIPALEGLLFNATSDRLVIIGSDMNSGITTRTDAFITQRGSIILNAKLISDIIRKLPDSTLTFETDENFRATISCGPTIFDLSGSSRDDYPEVPTPTREQALSIPQNILSAIIAGTTFSASEDETKPISTGCLFQVRGKELTVVALDYFRIALRKVTLTESHEDMSFVVPAKALREVDKFMTDTEDPIELVIGKRHISFEIGDTTLTTRLLEGEFLNYENAIPKTSPINIRAKTAALIDSFERVSIVTNDKLRNLVKCHFNQNSLFLESSSTLGKAKDECITTTLSGDDLTIGFNSRYILEALRACKEEEVLLELNTFLSPCLIRPVEGNAFLYMILPVRI